MAGKEQAAQREVTREDIDQRMRELAEHPLDITKPSLLTEIIRTWKIVWARGTRKET